MKQALVIGLGMFGMALARELSLRGVEVIGVDIDEERVDAAAEALEEVLCFDATDESALAEVHPGQRDVCVSAIGEDSRDASIVCTALLRQLGAPRLIARAYDRVHERILRLVGAHEVVNPEHNFGRTLAGRIAFSGVIDQVPLGAELVITEIAAPAALSGPTLRELDLLGVHQVHVVAVHDATEERGHLRLAEPDAIIGPGEVVVLAAKKGAVEAMLEKLG